MTRKASKTAAASASAQQVADHLDMTRQRVAQYEADGTFKRRPDGKFDLDQCRIALIRRLREQRQAVQTPERQRFDDARARRIELQNAKDEHSIVELEEVFVVLDELIGIAKTSFGGMPAAVTNDLALRNKIENQIRATMQLISDRYAKRAEELSTTGAVSI